MERIASVLIVGVVVGRVTAAVADPAVEAEQLFRDGRALLKAGKLAAACEAFEGSQRLEPAVATLLNLADCRERNLQLATAWSVYLQAASKARGDAGAARLAGVARDRAAALEPRLSFLTINVSDDSRVDGLTILRNGVALDPAVWNRAIPIDGGRYIITGKAPGLEPWSHTVEFQPERDHQSVNVPRFQVAAAPPAAEAALAAPSAIDHAVVRHASEPSPVAPAGRGPDLRAWGLAGGAVVVFGVAAGFELAGRASYDRYQRAPDPDAAQYDTANTRRHVALGLAVAGVGCAAAAAYLWFAEAQAPVKRTAWIPVVWPGVPGVAVMRGF